MDEVFRSLIRQAERLRETGMERHYKEQMSLAKKYGIRSGLLNGGAGEGSVSEEELLFEAEKSLGHLQFELVIEDKRSVFAMSKNDRKAIVVFDREITSELIPDEIPDGIEEIFVT